MKDMRREVLLDLKEAMMVRLLVGDVGRQEEEGVVWHDGGGGRGSVSEGGDGRNACVRDILDNARESINSAMVAWLLIGAMVGLFCMVSR